MPPVAPGGGEQKDPGTGVVWIIFGSVVFLFFIWWSAHTFIVKAILDFKLFELSIIQFFTDELSNVAFTLQHVDPSRINEAQIFTITTAIGSYFRYPAVLIIGLFGVLLYSRSSVSYFKHIYSMKTLLDNVIKLWPQSKPVVGVDLIKEDIDKGPWAMSMSPMQFAKRYHLLRVTEMVNSADQLSRQAQLVAKVIRTRANRIFATQLGREWQGVDRLPPHYKALYAVFAAKASRDSAGARDLLMALSDSFNSGKINYALANPLLQKYRDNKFVTEVVGLHAYELTVMAALLRLARTDGVISSAEFLWLKTIDRRLWFVLNSVGRQTAVVEAAGPFAHWLAENELGRRIKTPMVEVASQALDEAIQMIKYDPNRED